MIGRLRRRAGFAAMSSTAFLLLTAACEAPDTDASPASEQSAAVDETTALTDPEIPAGTEVLIRLAETVSTADNEAGDAFEAVVVDEVRSNDGSIAIPAGATVRGAVVQSHQSDGPDDPAVLAVRIESIEVDGRVMPLDASVVSAEPSTSTGATTAETAGKIAIGAAAGAILGQVVGKDTKATIAGAGAGAVAGTVIALSTRKGNATLESGSVIRVRLNEPIRPN